MSYEPKIVGFLCNWCSYTGADLAGTSRIQYPPNIRIIRVMCSARIDPTFVLQRPGARAPTACSSAAATRATATTPRATTRPCAAIPLLKRLLDAYGIEHERVRLEWVSASEGQRFADVVTDMTERLRALGPCRVKTALQTDQLER